MHFNVSLLMKLVQMISRGWTGNIESTVLPKVLICLDPKMISVSKRSQTDSYFEDPQEDSYSEDLQKVFPILKIPKGFLF